MRDGQQLRFPQRGSYGPGIDGGDVVVVLRLAPHQGGSGDSELVSFRVTASGRHLVLRQKVALRDALAGAPFRHLDGRVVRVAVPNGDVITPATTKL
eukprot:gene38325-42394_t